MCLDELEDISIITMSSPVIGFIHWEGTFDSEAVHVGKPVKTGDIAAQLV
jgi:hypothetical protein